MVNRRLKQEQNRIDIDNCKWLFFPSIRRQTLMEFWCRHRCLQTFVLQMNKRFSMFLFQFRKWKVLFLSYPNHHCSNCRWWPPKSWPFVHFALFPRTNNCIVRWPQPIELFPFYSFVAAEKFLSMHSMDLLELPLDAFRSLEMVDQIEMANHETLRLAVKMI